MSWLSRLARTFRARKLGGPLALREASRDVRLIPWLDSVARDVRFGLRVLRKDALVTWAAIVSLSLAIGACTAAFSLIEALILRPLPVVEPERLVYLTFSVAPLDGAVGAVEENAFFSYPLFERLREAGRPYVDLFGMNAQEWRRSAVFDDSGGQEERVRAQWVSEPRLLGAALRSQPVGAGPVADAAGEAVPDRGCRRGGAHGNRARLHDRPLGPEHDVEPGGAGAADLAVVPHLGPAEAGRRCGAGAPGIAAGLRRVPP